jgi:hypothetical protein
MHFNPSQNAIIWLQMHMHIIHKSLQKHSQTVFSRFLAATTFVPAKNTRHSEFPGHIPDCTKAMDEIGVLGVGYVILTYMYHLFSSLKFN